MSMQIDDKTRISGIELCWQIEMLRKSIGREVCTPTRFYKTFGIALHEAVQREIRTIPAIGFNQAIEAFNCVTEKYAPILDDVSKQVDDA